MNLKKLTYILVSQTCSNPADPVLIWLWMSIPAAILRNHSATWGRSISPLCFVFRGSPFTLVEQLEINCFSFKSLKRRGSVFTFSISPFAPFAEFHYSLSDKLSFLKRSLGWFLWTVFTSMIEYSPILAWVLSHCSQTQTSEIVLINLSHVFVVVQH